MDTLRDVMIERGATEQQLNSKTFRMAQDAIADDAVDGLAEARAAVARLTSRIGESESKLQIASANVVTATRTLKSEADRSEALLRQVSDANAELEDAVAKVTVTNADTMDAINAYTTVLSRTKAIVGDDMTEGIWVKAIEAASYGMWRAIMGPKESKGNSREKWL